MRFEHWIGEVGEKLKGAVEEGDLSEKDARAKWRHFKEHEFAPKLKDAVRKGHLSEEAGMEVWRRMEARENEHAGHPHDGHEHGHSQEALLERYERWIREDARQDQSRGPPRARSVKKKRGRSGSISRSTNSAPKLKAGVKEGHFSEQTAKELWKRVEEAEARERKQAAHRDENHEDHEQ